MHSMIAQRARFSKWAAEFQQRDKAALKLAECCWTAEWFSLNLKRKGVDIASVSISYDIRDSRKFLWKFGIYDGKSFTIHQAVDSIYDQLDLMIRGF